MQRQLVDTPDLCEKVEMQFMKIPKILIAINEFLETALFLIHSMT